MGVPWALWGVSWAPLGPLGCLSSASWAHLKCLGVDFGCFQGGFGRICGVHYPKKNCFSYLKQAFRSTQNVWYLENMCFTCVKSILTPSAPSVPFALSTLSAPTFVCMSCRHLDSQPLEPKIKLLQSRTRERRLLRLQRQRRRQMKAQMF